jgi:uncharacterized damage-inducible protein DinB
MSEISRIIDQLTREHDGDPWHGSPILQILDGVTSRQACARPIAVAHSIWELVLHVAAWKNEVRRRLAGAPAGDPEEGDWPTPDGTSDDSWRAALHQLQHAHERLVDAVRAFPEAKLDEASNDLRKPGVSAGDSYYVLLHGVVQHDVYHSGQIALLKKCQTGG